VWGGVGWPWCGSLLCVKCYTQVSCSWAYIIPPCVLCIIAAAAAAAATDLSLLLLLLGQPVDVQP